MGCVLFVTTLGLRPFGRGTHAVMSKIVQGDFKAPRELVHARQLGRQVGGGRRAADVGAQDVGIPLGVELFQLAQVEHDAVADFRLDRFRTDKQEDQQHAQGDDRRACHQQPAARTQARYTLRQYGKHNFPQRNKLLQRRIAKQSSVLQAGCKRM